MGAELGLFVGGGDSQELAVMQKFSETEGFVSDGIVAALRNKPESVTIRGGLTEYCVADTAKIALHFGAGEVIIDLHHCRYAVWDKGNDNNLVLRKETLHRGLGRKGTRDPRLHILPQE